MNENNNRVQAMLPEKTFGRAIELLNELDELLQAHMVGLSPDERMGLPKINVDNRDFVNDAINQMLTPDAAKVLPAFLNPQDAVSDIKMFGQLEQISVPMMALLAKVDSTRMLSGSEAYTTALLFKRLAEAGEAAGIPGAAKIAEALRERFKVNGTPAAKEVKAADKPTDQA